MEEKSQIELGRLIHPNMFRYLLSMAKELVKDHKWWLDLLGSGRLDLLGILREFSKPNILQAVLSGGYSVAITSLLKANSNKIAFVSGEKRITYGEFVDRINRLSNGLTDLGLKKGDNISVLIPNSNEFYEVGIFAPFLSGIRAGMINYHLRGDELADTINHLNAKTLIFDEEFMEEVSKIRPKLKNVKQYILVGEKSTGDMILYEDFLKKASNKDPTPITLTGGPILYTAGTTGRPKATTGVVDMLSAALPPVSSKMKWPPFEELSFEEFVWELLGLFQVYTTMYGLHKTTNIFLAVAPTYHAAPFAYTLFPLLTLSSTTVTMKKFDAEECLRLIEKERVSTTFVPPTILRRILALPPNVKTKYDLSSMRVIICGAAPCPVSVKKETNEFFMKQGAPGPVFNELYGSGDASLVARLLPEDYTKDPSKYDSVGKVAPGVKIKIIDENANEVPQGETGEIVAKTAISDSQGYYGEPDKIKDAYVSVGGKRYFRLGDIGYEDEDGFYHIVDRTTDMMVVGGVNIYPRKTEEVILKHPKVEDVAVFGVPDADLGEVARAEIKLIPGEKMTEKEVIDYCRESGLSGYYIPRSVGFVDELPRHTDGKMFKRELREKYLELKEKYLKK